jgi:hypothetical protein
MGPGSIRGNLSVNCLPFPVNRCIVDETYESYLQGSVLDEIVFYKVFMGDSRRYHGFSTAEGMGIKPTACRSDRSPFRAVDQRGSE